jgi:hypothetical protein
MPGELRRLLYSGKEGKILGAPTVLRSSSRTPKGGTKVSEEKDQRAPEPEEQQDVEGHMRGAMDEDEMRGMRGMRGQNDEESDDVEGHMRGAMDEEQMRGMRGANDEDDDVEGHMRGQNTP